MKATSWGSFPRLFFRFALLGKVENSRLERVWTTFLDPTFFAAWKSPSEWWHETDLVGFVPKDVLKFRLTGASRLGAFQTRLDDPLKLAFGASWFLPKLGVALFLFCPLQVKTPRTF